MKTPSAAYARRRSFGSRLGPGFESPHLHTPTAPVARAVGVSVARGEINRAAVARAARAWWGYKGGHVWSDVSKERPRHWPCGGDAELPLHHARARANDQELSDQCVRALRAQASLHADPRRAQAHAVGGRAPAGGDGRALAARPRILRAAQSARGEKPAVVLLRRPALLEEGGEGQVIGDATIQDGSYSLSLSQEPA